MVLSMHWSVTKPLLTNCLTHKLLSTLLMLVEINTEEEVLARII